MKANQVNINERNTMETETIKYIEKIGNDAQKRNEIEFKINKHNVNVRLSGDNKYYHANQCALFIRNVQKYGFGHITQHDIYKNGVCFNEYSINNGYNQYCRDMKRFSNKQEMLGFVIGYNQAIEHREVA
jgi:exopolyphosphatase/pppGpp-phosphohydrolase